MGVEDNTKYDWSIGIDIGKNGGIACIRHDDPSKIHVIKTPLVNKNDIDITALSELLINRASCARSIHIGIEDVHSIFGTGAKANFEFGRSLGIIEGIIGAIGIPFTKIAPKTWQKEMWMGVKIVEVPTGKVHKKLSTPVYKTDTKATSLAAVKRLYPSMSFQSGPRSKKEHDGMVDALLIATYVRRRLHI